jgi:hypothetical protein
MFNDIVSDRMLSIADNFLFSISVDVSQAVPDDRPRERLLKPFRAGWTANWRLQVMRRSFGGVPFGNGWWWTGVLCGMVRGQVAVRGGSSCNNATRASHLS